MSFRQVMIGKRKIAGVYTDGIYVPASESTINFTASVQPVSGDEMETLPEGLREAGMYRLYTDFALRTVNQKTKTPADEIDYADKKYIIVFVQPWQNNVINHYKAFMSEGKGA